MAAYICFLRGVNVGGKGKVPMAELKALLEELGFENVKTVLQSGNVVFTTRKGTAASLTRKVEAAIEKTFKYRSDVHLLTPAALRAIVDGNPYPKEAKDDPSHLVVMVVSKAPDKTAMDKLKALAKPGEKFTVTPQAVYLHYAHTIADSKMVGAAMDRALGVRGTGRNWNTVNKLLDLAEAL
jgi:uncharacterized protein (DUF1697 family)